MMSSAFFRVACVAAILLAAQVPAAAQGSSQVRELFESGKYQEVIDAAGPEAEPPVIFAALQSHQKLGAVDQANTLARRLADMPADSPWHFIGVSATGLLGDQTDAALDAGRRAADMAGDLPEAHYQLGLVLAKRQEWKDAAAAFDRASTADPQYAYAYYYGGLMHYRANRPDLMAVRFERFLKLAPEAPERPEVLQIMRTIRGR